MTYTNLHTHTIYSLLDGHGKIDAYMQRAVMLGMTHLAITDHGNISGWLDFYESALANGITPILGSEMYQARKSRFDRDDEERAGGANDEIAQAGPYHLTVLARNNTGYNNLIKLSSQAYLEGFYVKPRMDYELLEEYSDGLIVLSGCLNGAVAQSLLLDDYESARSHATHMQDILGKDHFFLEIHDHGIPEQRQIIPYLLQLSKDIGAPLVPAGDCHYVNKEDSDRHDVYLCVSTGAKIDDEGRFAFRPEEFYLKSYDEMLQRFDPEWLKNTMRVAEQVEVNLTFGELHFPEYEIPTKETVDEFLERNVWEGIRERYGDPIPHEVRERTEHELGVVKRMGFQSYFLVVSDLVKWAKDNGIRVGYGRGSAAGSILSYALRITNLDPLRFGLLFERFLVEGRKSMPDIDLDFDDRYRDKVIQYARERYGHDRVAHIATFQQIKAKQAIRDATRVLGYEYAIGDKIAKAHPKAILGVEKSLEEAMSSKEFRTLYETDDNAKTIIDSARGLEGVLRSSGIHAAGVVIAKEPITNFVPIMQRPDKNQNTGPITTQWDMHRVEQCGQLKVDFLGLRNLGVIDRCIENITGRRDMTLDLDTLDLEDEKTYSMLREGKSQGVFQLESGGMRAMMLALQPTVIEDLMALVSLYRPGPLGSGMDKLYIERKHGRQKVVNYHPVLADVLEKTYGIMLYQEDILRVARVLAGFDVGEADDLRKAIGKKQMDKIGLFREKFVQGCRDTHNVDPNIANKIYSDIEYFGGYGFNLAHAASYAMISYVTAYLKANFPAEYMAGLLSSVKDKEKAAPYLAECRNIGITVTPPSINESVQDFTVRTDEEILCGLSAIGGIGQAIVDYILTGRNDQPYESIYDFFRRANTEVLNKGTLESLLYAGAFDELVPDIPTRTLSRDEKVSVLNSEQQKLGLYVSDHPLTGVWHLIEEKVDGPILELDTRIDGEYVSIGGVITNITGLTTKRGDQMYRCTLEDLSADVEVIVFPNKAPHFSLDVGDIVIMSGRLQQEGDEEAPIPKLIYVEHHMPTLPQYGTGQPITVRFQSRPTYATLDKMRQLVEDNPGDCSVLVEFPERSHDISLAFKRPASSAIKEQLEAFAECN